MFQPNQYNCRYSRAYYICSGQKQAFVNLQKAIDRLINLLPIFRPIKPAPGQNPIGSSKAGYDGVVGPTTSGLGLTALIGAFEVRREALGEAPSPDAVVIAMRNTKEVERTTNFAKYALEITAYLNETSDRFPELMEQIKAQEKAKEDTSVIVAPPPMPLPVPTDIAKQFKSPALKIAGWGGGLLVGGLLLWGIFAAAKSKDRQQYNPYRFT